MPDASDLYAASTLNAAYASALDADRLEEWPSFFLERCMYKVTTADNHASGYQAGLIYADCQAMLTDRVTALRRANVYERQRYRHVLGMPLLRDAADGTLAAETSFIVIRTMRGGEMTVFAAGIYLDRLARDHDGVWRYAERVAICDSPMIDTLLAIPL